MVVSSPKNLKPHELVRLGSPKKRRRRVGRGNGSGSGKTSGRGQKGAGARAGHKRNARFEGGQTPILMRFPRLPGTGNHRFSQLRYEPVNVESLNVFSKGDIVGPAELIERGIANSGPIKILGRGELNTSLTVRATCFSAGAVQKIEAAGGNVEQIEADSRTSDGDNDTSIDN